jgi:hypothetical protein
LRAQNPRLNALSREKRCSERFSRDLTKTTWEAAGRYRPQYKDAVSIAGNTSKRHFKEFNRGFWVRGDPMFF